MNFETTLTICGEKYQLFSIDGVTYTLAGPIVQAGTQTTENFVADSVEKAKAHATTHVVAKSLDVLKARAKEGGHYADWLRVPDLIKAVEYLNKTPRPQVSN